MSSKPLTAPLTTVKISDLKAAPIKVAVPKATAPTKPAPTEKPAENQQTTTKPEPAGKPAENQQTTTKPEPAGKPAENQQATTKPEPAGKPAENQQTTTKPEPAGKPAENQQTTTKPEPAGKKKTQPTPVKKKAAHTTPGKPTSAPGVNPLCPRCKSVLTVKSGKLPELCPTCHFILRAERQKAFNHNFELAFRKAFVWRGRATRREFWGFAVIMGGIGLLLALALDIVCNGLIAKLIAEYIAPIPALPELLWYIITPMLGAALLIWVLALPLPLLSLTIRRLHDVGRSMLWLTVAGLCWLGTGLATSASAISMLLALLCGADAAAAETAPIAALIEHSMLATLVLGGLATIFTLAIGMFSLMDSQRGSNKYGPSAKYPLE